MKLLDVAKTKYHGKNIMTVEVPAQLRVKHATGIDWVDFMLGGGFTPSTCWLFTGDSGCGKTTASFTIADALTAMGHEVVVNGREEIVYQMKMTTERLGLEHGFIATEHVFVDDLIEDLKARQKKSKKQVICIVDSLQCLDSGKYDTGRRTKNTPIQCAEKLIAWAKDTFGILVMINHVTKGGHFAGNNTLLHAVDAWLHLGFDRDKKSPTLGERVLRKDKDRFGPAVPPVVVEMGVGGKLSHKVIDEASDVDEEVSDAEDLDAAAE